MTLVLLGVSEDAMAKTPVGGGVRGARIISGKVKSAERNSHRAVRGLFFPTFCEKTDTGYP